jgi:hypothetical protein
MFIILFKIYIIYYIVYSAGVRKWEFVKEILIFRLEARYSLGLNRVVGVLGGC